MNYDSNLKYSLQNYSADLYDLKKNYDRLNELDCLKATHNSKEIPKSNEPDFNHPKSGDVEPQHSTTVLSKPKTKRPNLYRVLLLNDDYTPMEFVIIVLEGIFHKSRVDATQIMLHVHNHGVGECGIFTYEIAETKVSQVLDLARKHSHPLQCVMEKKDA